MSAPPRSQKLEDHVYMNLTEQGAYEVSRIVQCYVAPGWTKVSLRFVVMALGGFAHSEGAVDLWTRLFDHGELGHVAWLLDPPEGEVNELEWGD